MKFLRFVAAYQEDPESSELDGEMPFTQFLHEKFGLPPASHDAILALTLSTSTAQDTTTGFAVPRIARHLGSIGVFGPGFGALAAKWGGLAEVSQVACRACAVGGGVYVLGKGIEQITSAGDSMLALALSGGEKVTTSWVAATDDDLPEACFSSEATVGTYASRSISIISSPLACLFPPTSEGGVTPVGAVVLVPSIEQNQPPVHILVHSSDSGECASGQSTYNILSSLQHNLVKGCQTFIEYLSTLSEQH